MMVFKCIMCGRDVLQKTSTPRLYCSDKCSNEQEKLQKYSKEWLTAEKIRRKQTYKDSLPPEEQKRMALRKGKDKFYHYTSKPKPDPEKPKHLCVSCKKPCVDYRCPACWRKIRRKLGLIETVVPSESIWDGF